MKDADHLAAIRARKQKRGFLVALQRQLEKMGTDIKKQQLSEYLSNDPKTRVEPKLSMGLRIIEASKLVR
jgi:hypothetical protein